MMIDEMRSAKMVHVSLDVRVALRMLDHDWPNRFVVSKSTGEYVSSRDAVEFLRHHLGLGRTTLPWYGGRGTWIY